MIRASANVVITRWDAGKAGDFEGPALRRVLVRPGLAWVEVTEPTGPVRAGGPGGAAGVPPRPRARGEAAESQTAAAVASQGLRTSGARAGGAREAREAAGVR
jgi:hypothetical protein